MIAASYESNLQETTSSAINFTFLGEHYIILGGYGIPDMRVLDLRSLTGQDIDVPMENLTCTCHFLFPALKPTVKDVLLSFRPNSGAGKSYARTDTAWEHSSAVLFHADPLQAVIVAVVGYTFDDADVKTKSFEFAFPSATLLSYLDRLRGPPSNHVVKWEESRQRFGTRARMSDFVNGRIHGCCGTRTVVCPIGYDDPPSCGQGDGW